MHLEFRVKPINDKKDTYWTAPSVPILAASEPGFMILLHDFDARTFSCYNSVLRKI